MEVLIFPGGYQDRDHSAATGQLPLNRAGELYDCVLSGDLPCTLAVGEQHRLEQALPPGAQLACCATCLFSDYSPGGHGLTGIRCHRDAKDQYLAVRSKRDYWSVPVTEDVPETYLCDEYQRRVPGTGYRG